MLLLRKVDFGFVWFVLFYFTACALIGGFAGGRDPQHAEESGRIAGEQAVMRYKSYILGGSLLSAVAGSAAGVLPGTRCKAGEQKAG